MDTTQYQPVKLAIGAFGALFAVTALSLAVCTNVRTYAETSSEDDITVTIKTACTFTGDDSGTEHSKTITPGTYESNIGTTRMTAVCNDPAGYAIYAVGYTNNEWKNNTLSYTSGGNEYTIPTGTATSGSTSNWAMKLTTGSDSGVAATIVSPYNNYAVVPGGSAEDPGDKSGDYAKVAERLSATTATTGTSLTSTYQVYANSAQPAGTYTGQVKYTLVHPYNADAPEAKDPSICDTQTCMQDLDSTSIATLLPAVGRTATVYDARDEQAYTIAKLADNKYWMTTNLNLAGGTTLNASDSNVPSDNYYTLPDSTAITSGTSVPSDQFSNDSTAYVFNTGNNTTTCNSSTPCNSYYSWLAATAGGKDSSGTAVTTNGYNAAYSICPKGWRLPTSTTSNASAQTSPNWKTGDWYTLMTAYGANLESNYYENAGTFYNNAGPGTTPNFLLAGGYYSGSFYNGGSFGNYWSASSFSSSGGYYGAFGSSLVYSANNGTRRYGLSVRCLFAE